MLQDRLMKYSFDDAEYAGQFDNYLREVCPSYVFKEYIKLKFENKMFSCIKHYDYFLRRLYGDYMKLPPLEEQKSTHNLRAYWR
jgi:lipopolysaccharide cholinephosphotransferase